MFYATGGDVHKIINVRQHRVGKMILNKTQLIIVHHASNNSISFDLMLGTIRGRI